MVSKKIKFKRRRMKKGGNGDDGIKFVNNIIEIDIDNPNHIEELKELICSDKDILEFFEKKDEDTIEEIANDASAMLPQLTPADTTAETTEDKTDEITDKKTDETTTETTDETTNENTNENTDENTDKNTEETTYENTEEKTEANTAETTENIEKVEAQSNVSNVSVEPDLANELSRIQLRHVTDINKSATGKPIGLLPMLEPLYTNDKFIYQPVFKNSITTYINENMNMKDILIKKAEDKKKENTNDNIQINDLGKLIDLLNNISVGGKRYKFKRKSSKLKKKKKSLKK